MRTALMFRRLSLGFLLAAALAGAGYCAAAEKSLPAPEPSVSPSTATASGLREVTAAVGTLNYRMEVLQARYLELVQEVGDLQSSLQEQRKAVQACALPKTDAATEARLKELEAQVSRMQEEVASLKEKPAQAAAPAGATEEAPTARKAWLEKNWLGGSALVLSFAALLIAL